MKVAIWRTFSRALAGTVCVIYCSSCTTTETDPTRASTGDFLMGYGRLNNYLEERRTHLASLHSDLQELDLQIELSLGKLFRVRKELEAAREAESISREAREKMESYVQKQMETKEKLRNRISESEKRVQSLEAEKVRRETEIAEDQRQIEEVRARCDKLTEDNKVMDAAIERTLNLKTEQLLGESV